MHFSVLLRRFLSVYIEHTGGKFPVWTASEQARLITVNQDNEIVDLANKIQEEAVSAGLRVALTVIASWLVKRLEKLNCTKFLTQLL